MISVITPFYNEEQVIHKFFSRLIPILNSLNHPYEIVCVNDGSNDATLSILIEYATHSSNVKVIDLSRNFGKEAALTAALSNSRGDAVIPMDCDLQDPPELIPKMVQLWNEGAEVVLARRVDRSSDSWIKRTSAALFYKLHNNMSNSPIPENVGDFRLMDRAVIDVVCSMPERCRFMKGVFAWAGFTTTTIDYVRESREAGNTKFNGWKLWNFALEGITSFSTAPLRVWLYLGMVISFFSFFYACTIIIKTLYLGVQLPGYASVMASILFLGGIQLIGIGVLGEYVGRTYIETKSRPLYVIRKIYNTGI
jgi:glycosyltransferase involved in cell wall biosynthesis